MMDEYHEKYPNRCIGLSEYGCEGIITYQGGNPKCKDYSEAYQAGYHEYMAHMLERRLGFSAHMYGICLILGVPHVQKAVCDGKK